MTTVDTDEVVVRWRSQSALAASVRDGDGVFDLLFDVTGWTCSCAAPNPCAHVQRVRVLGAVVTS